VNNIITKRRAEIIFQNAEHFPENTQIAIAVITNGKVNYYGLKRGNDTISTIDNSDNVFEIGSITKVFTSTLLANFIVNGKIKPDDNINDYLNIPFNNDIKISFLSLANHTSGLPRLPSNLDLTKADPENPYKDYTEQDLKEYLTKFLEVQDKGKYRYSNLGAGLLGYTLSRIGNTDYENLLQKMIFSKYDMHNSTSDINKIKGNPVKGLSSNGKEVPNWDFSVLAGAGGIFSTAEDMAKFAAAQFDTLNTETALTREITFEVNKDMAVGLGWHILRSRSENLWYWHNGGTGGYSSSMVIDTKTKNGIIVLSNVSAFNPGRENIDGLCFGLMKTLDGE
ncbi:MAG: beta-lactamase family protein, partial [Chlorobi bacterium]|nr:beta-lactamase family protein [Chlorobiota bacterium]